MCCVRSVSALMMRARAIVGLLAFVALLSCTRTQEQPEAPARFLTTSPLRKDTDVMREYVGQIRAIQHIELRAQERGYLTAIFVDEGKLVRPGQKMFQIMPLLYQAELNRARSETQFAEIEYQNTKVLADGNVVSANELALAKAKLSKAQAAMALAQVRLDLTAIKAPFSGIMGRFQVRLGSLVDEGDLLTTLSDNETMWVYFNVSEAEYLDYKSHANDDSSMPVQLRMANGKLFAQTGKVETIEADFNNETGNIAFRAAFQNPKGLLRHGETGKVLMTMPIKNALIIPQKATFDVLDKKYVYVIDAHDFVHQRQITVSHELPNLYIVERGLSDTDKILIDGLRKVRDGSEIAEQYEPPAQVFAGLELPVR